MSIKPSDMSKKLDQFERKIQRYSIVMRAAAAAEMLTE